MSLDITATFIGILLGMIIILFLLILAWWTKSFTFSYCANESSRFCRIEDYYEYPEDAILAGAREKEILFVSDGHLKYKKVKRSGFCFSHHKDLIATVAYPQYCHFRANDGQDHLYKQLSTHSTFYQPIDGYGPVIETDKHCQPLSDYTYGFPVARWDP